MKLKVFVKDGHRIEEYKAKYDPDDQIVEIKKKTGLLTREPERFKINPDHIYERLKKGGKKIEYWVFVSRRSRESVKIGNGKKIEVSGESEPIGNLNDPPEVDQKKRNKLDFLVDKAFWKAMIEKARISTFTALIMMFAGYGIIRFLEWMIFYIMQSA